MAVPPPTDASATTGSALRATPVPPAERTATHAVDPARALGDDVLRRTDYPVDCFLRTRRMRLQTLGYRHLLDLLQLGREERVTELLLDGHLDSVADAAGLVVWSNRLYAAQPGLGHWHASDERGGFIGMFSLTPGDREHDVGLGARLLPRAWGRGYALEGAEALCAHAFTALALPHLVALCDPRNAPVPPVLRRLGFADAGDTLHFGQPALRFVLACEDWRGVRPRERRTATSPLPAADPG